MNAPGYKLDYIVFCIGFGLAATLLASCTKSNTDATNAQLNAQINSSVPYTEAAPAAAVNGAMVMPDASGSTQANTQNP